MSKRFPRGCRFVELWGLNLASIHISPLFLKPHALAGTLTPSGLDSLPPDFAPCWKALHPAWGTLGSCSHKLPGYSPLRLGKSSIANSSLPSTPAERSSLWLGQQAFASSPWGGWLAGSPTSFPRAPRGPSCSSWLSSLSPGRPALGRLTSSLQSHLLLVHPHPKLLVLAPRPVILAFRQEAV